MKIKLNEQKTNNIDFAQLLRVGKFAYLDRTLKFTKETLKEIKQNYDNNVRGVQLAVDYFHEAYDKAAGWIKNIELRNNDSELWMQVEWTESAKKQILAKELRYISAELNEQYIDKETKKNFGAVLYGAGLTNRPHINKMAAILSEKTQNENIINFINTNEKGLKMEFQDLLNMIDDLTADEKAQIIEKINEKLESEDENLTEEVEATENNKETSKAEDHEKVKMNEEAKEDQKEAAIKVDDKKVELAENSLKIQEENIKLKEEIESLKKEERFNVLLSEGLAVESQRLAFLNNDLEAFAKNSINVNLSEKGINKTKNTTITEDQAITKLSEIADNKVKEFGYTFDNAMKYALKENQELAKIIK
jgi:phage I-like protein